MRGAVWGDGVLAVVDDLEVQAPGPGQATVRVLASGICHSDLNVLDGRHTVPTPVVLGHEGAGVVDAIGPGVTGVAIGDEVVIASDTSGADCRPFTWRGRPVRAYAGVASFAERTTVDAHRLARRDGLPAAPAALVGCAASTGWGVVNNVVGVQSGQTVAVLGVGGVGVNAIAAARLAGAIVVAVDVDPDKEAVARHFGAQRFAARLDDRVDVTIECSGAPAAIEAAIAMTGPGGTTALVGIPPPGYRPTFDVNHLFRGRRIVGSYNGAVQASDLSTIIGLADELDLAGQVSRVWPLAEIADAIAAVRSGGLIRAVLDLS